MILFNHLNFMQHLFKTEKFSLNCLFIASILLISACGSPQETGQASVEDPFPESPADGPVAISQSTAGDYRPTAAGAPSTDIWLGNLVISDDGISVSDLRNITDRDGYDNQPSFSPDGKYIYYSSAVDSQTEISRYNIISELNERVTNTPDASEFSPLFIPGQDAFTTTHEAQDLQHLWRYSADGEETGPVFGTARPVGYHAWADNKHAVMFILGNPATLVVGNALTGELRTVAENPGRSIHRVPGTDQISFIRYGSNSEAWLEKLDPVSGESSRLTRITLASQDYAWTPKGGVLMGEGQKLYYWDAETEWTEAADLSGENRGPITRIAVSPDGSRVAIVMNRTDP